jgi:hypothetical protein
MMHDAKRRNRRRAAALAAGAVAAAVVFAFVLALVFLALRPSHYSFRIGAPAPHQALSGMLLSQEPQWQPLAHLSWQDDAATAAAESGCRATSAAACANTLLPHRWCTVSTAAKRCARSAFAAFAPSSVDSNAIVYSGLMRKTFIVCVKMDGAASEPSQRVEIMLVRSSRRCIVYEPASHGVATSIRHTEPTQTLTLIFPLTVDPGDNISFVGRLPPVSPPTNNSTNDEIQFLIHNFSVLLMPA